MNHPKKRFNIVVEISKQCWSHQLLLNMVTIYILNLTNNFYIHGRLKKKTFIIQHVQVVSENLYDLVN